MDGIPEAKRPVRGTSARSNTAAAAAVAEQQPAAAAAKPDETWEDIAERTGMSVEDLLNKKVAFKKGTLPAKKLEEMGPVIKELKYVVPRHAGNQGKLNHMLQTCCVCALFIADGCDGLSNRLLKQWNIMCGQSATPPTAALIGATYCHAL